MKQIVRTSLFFIPIILFSAFSSMMSVNPSVLDASGYILEDDKKVEGAIVKLYQDNLIVDKLSTKKNGKFRFILFSNSEYMIEINKTDCVPERVYLSTKNAGDLADKYYFEFVVDLMKLKEFEGVDVSNLDFPTAVINYDADKDEYVHDKMYSRSVRADLRKMKEEKDALKK
jgi:hypothetical protein